MSYKIGLFDSGIGGFSILNELFKILPYAQYFYYSDEAFAPYGPKTDEFITDRAFVIVNELLSKGVDIIVVACNTATAASIDKLREHFPQVTFVGVEPYLNAYNKGEGDPRRMVVLTTESTGKSERFKRLKNRIDPAGVICHISLKNLAQNIEDFYHCRMSEEKFNTLISEELSAIKKMGYSHAILGCTHYPLVADKIQNILKLKALSPCPFVASRVKELLTQETSSRNVVAKDFKEVADTFQFYSSFKCQWAEINRSEILGPFHKLT